MDIAAEAVLGLSATEAKGINESEVVLAKLGNSVTEAKGINESEFVLAKGDTGAIGRI